MKTAKRLLAVLALVISVGISFPAIAQKSAPPDAGDVPFVFAPPYEKLESKLLRRNVPYRVLLPKNYEADKGQRYPVIYLLHGLFGHFNNWTDKTVIEEVAARYRAIIVTPEGADGWYTDNATVPDDKYESYIVQELIPEIDKKYRTINKREGRAIAGLSMGGYGALKFALKFPDKFVIAGSFSGALDAPLRGQDHKSLRPSIVNVYGPDNSRTRVENDIYRIVREMPEDKAKSLPFLYLDCGTEDFLIQPNRDFAALLFEKKIPHEFRQLPGGHAWQYWERQVQEFLELANERMNGQAETVTEK